MDPHDRMDRQAPLDLDAYRALFTGARRADAADIDKVLAVLAQVTLAVLITFVMIAILFSSESRDEARYYRHRAEQLAQTPKNEALVALQRQKLLLALERTNHHYRHQLGHLVFYTQDARHRRVINTENIITGRTIRKDFIRACDFAQQALIPFDGFVARYTEMVFAEADLAPQGVAVSLARLDPQNQDWFENQVRSATRILHQDTIRLQEDAKERLAVYYQTHLSEVAELRELAASVSLDSTEGNIDSFMRRVKIFVERELERQEVRFLQVTAGPS